MVCLCILTFMLVTILNVSKDFTHNVHFMTSNIKIYEEIFNCVIDTAIIGVKEKRFIHENEKYIYI